MRSEQSFWSYSEPCCDHFGIDCDRFDLDQDHYYPTEIGSEPSGSEPTLAVIASGSLVIALGLFVTAPISIEIEPGATEIVRG